MARSDHYATLGVSETASAEQIRAAYRRRARQLHPDRVVDPVERIRAEARMSTVNEAWRVLGDQGLRTAYDRERRPDQLAGSPQVTRSYQPTAPDLFDDVEVPAAVGCVLRFGPVLLAVGLLVGLLIVTALASGGGDSPTRLAPGRCVEVGEGLRVVPCALGVSEIVSRGVAGTSCPQGSAAVVLGTRTDQVCVAPHG
ncbi:MAG: DnaJ domain-containing protein [Actinomycetota bacterium]|nr:DnaJ domain-containing protein [Actinomycetota bacterium]